MAELNPPAPQTLDTKVEEQIAKIVANDRRLKQANFNGKGIGDIGATKAAEALKANSVLQLLHLGNNRIGDTGATELSEALKSNSSLESLYLASNVITDVGAAKLREALLTNFSLRTLTLGVNPITDTDATKEIDASLARNVEMKAKKVKPGNEPRQKQSSDTARRETSDGSRAQELNKLNIAQDDELKTPGGLQLDKGVQRSEDEIASIAEDVLSSEDARGGVPFMRSMLLICGQGRSGKTATRRALLGQSFQQTDSTIGIDQALLSVNIDSLETTAPGQWRSMEEMGHTAYDEAHARLVARKMRRDTEQSGPVADSAENAPSDFADHSGQQHIQSFLQRYIPDDARGPVESVKPDSEERMQSADTPAPLNSLESPKNSTAKSVETPAVSKVVPELVLKYVDSKEAEPLKISLWDFGGQDVFYSLHHLFITRFAVYLLVFNMEWLTSTAPQEKKTESLNYLRFWLNSIAVNAIDRKGGSMAPILLVGTHKDVVSDAGEHGRISDLLDQTFSRSPAWTAILPFQEGQRETGRSLLWFFPCDNTLGVNKDAVFMKMMKIVQDTMLAEEYTRCRVPLPWIQVYDRLQADNRTCISFSEFQEVARHCGLPTTSNQSLAKEAEALALFLSWLGFVMYHLDPSLRDTVVLNPAAFMIKPATQFICSFKEHFTEQHAKARKLLRGSFKMLTERALLQRKLLPVLWEEHREHVPQLESLMVKFGLIVPILAKETINQTEDEADDEADEEGQEMQYLVPALLHKGEVAKVEMRMVTTCFLIFGLAEQYAEWSTGCWLSLSEVQQDGFLPDGVFSRLIGKCIDQAQRTGHGDLRMMELYEREIRTSYGDHKFALIWPQDANYLRLHVLSDLPLAVLHTILDQIQACCSECVPNLRCVVGIPADGGITGSTFDAYKNYTGNVVILGGNSGLEARLRERKPIPIGRTVADELQVGEAQKLFARFLPPTGRLEQYDVFLSYRWSGLDKWLVRAIFSDLSLLLVDNRGIRVFLDQERLGKGIDLKFEFSHALLHSSVAVPVISAAALEKMKHVKESEQDIDNVHLEWTLMVEQLENRRLKFILPILMGTVSQDADGNETIGHLFKEGHIAQLPEVIVGSVNQKASNLLREHGIDSSSNLSQRSVLSTVRLLADQSGLPAWSIKPTVTGRHAKVHKEMDKRNILVSHCVKEIRALVCQANEALQKAMEGAKEVQLPKSPAESPDATAVSKETRHQEVPGAVVAVPEDVRQDLVPESVELKTQSSPSHPSGCCTLC